MNYAFPRPPGALRAAALLFLLGAGASGLQAQEAPPAEPYAVGGGVIRPEKIAGLNPAYTEMARRAQVTGSVILEVIIDEQGNPTNVKVVKGLPLGLDQAAVNAVRTWKFKPATLEGRPVKVCYTLTVNFEAEQGPATMGRSFRDFVEKHPDFAAHLQFDRYQEAMDLLDRWAAEQPADSEIDLARCFLLLAQGRLEEAWSVGLAYRGPDRYDVLSSVGAMAYVWAADPNLAAVRRAELIEIGLQAESEAMAANPEDAAEAASYKSLLLREKAQRTRDPAERKALKEQAAELEKLTRELQVKRQAAEATSDATMPETPPPLM